MTFTRKSNIFVYFCLCFVVGVGVGSFLGFDLFYIFVVGLVAGLLVIIFWQQKSYRIIFLGAIFLLLGVWRFDLAQPNLNTKNHIVSLTNSDIEFEGQVCTEPDERASHVKLTLCNLEVDATKVDGKVLINYYKFSDIEYGDQLQVKCFLEQPGVFQTETGDFDYGQYLAAKGIYAVCYKTDSLIKNSSTPTGVSLFYKNIIRAKQKFKHVIDTSLPVPHSALLNAMLLGYRREIPQSMSDNFSGAGISHLIAISGLHITFLGALLFYIFVELGVRRDRSFWLIISILFLYVLMIGFRASAVRAFIMGSVLLYAFKIGRLGKSLNSLLLSAVILLIINPKLLIFDIGFQLSFLAVLGILFFYPILDKRFDFITDKFKIRSMIILTLSAQTLTLPLVFYYFKVISFSSPLTNLLILPLLPIIMTGGFVLIVSGLVWSKLALGVGVILYFVLEFIIRIASVLSVLSV